jgi:glutathione-regulated potassium-efflux system ancillary protein KefG
MHLLYWYSTPAILKEWQDLVLEHVFAYGHEGTKLHGKIFFLRLLRVLPSQTIRYKGTIISLSANYFAH